MNENLITIEGVQNCQFMYAKIDFARFIKHEEKYLDKNDDNTYPKDGISFEIEDENGDRYIVKANRYCFSKASDKGNTYQAGINVGERRFIDIKYFPKSNDFSIQICDPRTGIEFDTLVIQKIVLSGDSFALNV
jgi:hypothetical protein